MSNVFELIMHSIYGTVVGFLIGAMLMVHHFTETIEVLCIPDEEVTVEQVREFGELQSYLDDHACFRIVE